MSAQTHTTLDAALQAHLLDEFGETLGVVTHWTLVAATVHGEGPGLIAEHSEYEVMPAWQVRGLLSTGLLMIDDEEAIADE